MRVKSVVAQLGALALALGTSFAGAGPYCPAPDKLFYTLEERADGNAVVAYTLTDSFNAVESGRYATGGKSFGASYYGDHQLVRSGDVILVPNSGSNTISSL